MSRFHNLRIPRLNYIRTHFTVSLSLKVCIGPIFEKKLESLFSEGGERVREFVREISFENWTNAHFKGKIYGEMCSNIAEPWNAKIVKA